MMTQNQAIFLLLYYRISFLDLKTIDIWASKTANSRTQFSECYFELTTQSYSKFIRAPTLIYRNSCFVYLKHPFTARIKIKYTIYRLYRHMHCVITNNRTNKIAFTIVYWNALLPRVCLCKYTCEVNTCHEC